MASRKQSSKLWAIREISTGYFIPAVPNHQRGGGTASETMPMKHAVPRLFTRHQDAACMLTWWLRGEARGGRYDGGPSDVVPQPHRKAADMEIVEVKLCVK